MAALLTVSTIQLTQSAWTYWLSPVAASPYTIMIERYTTGFFHRALQRILASEALVHVVYFMLYMTAIPVVWHMCRDLYQRVRRRQTDFAFFLDLCIMSFLIVMPFAYMAWEKYFLLVIPIGIVRFLLMAFPALTAAEHKAETSCA